MGWPRTDRLFIARAPLSDVCMMAGPRHCRLLHDMGMGECASASHDELILGVAALLPRKKGNQGRPVQDTRGRRSPLKICIDEIGAP